MKNFLEKNINAIEAGGGFVDVGWLESDVEAPDGITARVETDQEGRPDLVVTVNRKSGSHAFRNHFETVKQVAEKYAGMEGKHAVIYGLGAGRHVEEALRAVGDGGEVMALECSRPLARAALEGIDFEEIASRPNARIFIGPGGVVAPMADARVRQIERGADELLTMFHSYRPSRVALPWAEHRAHEFIRRVEGGFFLKSGWDNPLMVDVYHAIQKNILRGGPLTDIEMAFLFVESWREEGRYHYSSSDYEPARPPEKTSRLLVCSLSAIGDAVSASAALPGLREIYPGAEITFLTETPAAPLFRHGGYADRVAGYPCLGILNEFVEEPTWAKLVGTCEKFLKIAGELRAGKFDAVVNTHQSARSALLIGMLDLPPDRCMGYRIGRDGIGAVRGNVWQRMRMTGHAEIDMHREESAMLMFEAPCAERRTGAVIPEGDGELALPQFLAKPSRGKAIGISPFVSNFTRNWGLERYFVLCKLLAAETDRDFIIFAGAGKEEKEVAEFIHEFTGARASVCAGQSLDRAAWAARECELFITNDTGPMHIAGAAGARCLAILGPTHILPYSAICHVGVIAAAPCTNCNNNNPCRDMKCFDLIEPAQVAALARLMLDKGREGALTELAGESCDFPHRLITTGTYESLTPRYPLVLRGAGPREADMAYEFANIAAYNVIHLYDAGALESGAHPRGVDMPGLLTPFSPEASFREVVRRYFFVKPDYKALKEQLDSQVERVEAARRSTGFASEYFDVIHPVRRFVRGTGFIEDSRDRDRMVDLCVEFLEGVGEMVLKM